MIKIIIFILFLPFFCFAQKEALSYIQTNDIDIVKQYKNNNSIDSYITKSNLTINIGDTLTIGSALIKRKEYLFTDIFTYIVSGKTNGSSKEENIHLPHNYSGSKVVVKSIFVTHERYTGYKLWPKRNEMPLYISIFVRSPQKGFSKMLGYSRMTILDIEKALSSAEIINHNVLLSKRKNENIIIDPKQLNITKDYRKYDILLKLVKLKESSILTDEEFEREKKKILDSE